MIEESLMAEQASEGDAARVLEDALAAAEEARGMLQEAETRARNAKRDKLMAGVLAFVALGFCIFQMAVKWL